MTQKRGLRRAEKLPRYGDIEQARRHLLTQLSRRLDPISALASVRFRFGMQCSRALEAELAATYLKQHAEFEERRPQAS